MFGDKGIIGNPTLNKEVENASFQLEEDLMFKALGAEWDSVGVP